MKESNSNIKINTVISQQESKLNTTLDLTQNIDKIINIFLNNLSVKSQNLEVQVQVELSRILNIIRRIKRFISSSKFQKNKQIQSEVEIMIRNLVLAFDTLQENSNLTLASRIRMDTERAMHYLETPLIGSILNIVDSFLYASSTGLKILIGLVLALPLYIAIPASMFILLDNASSNLQKSALISDSKNARLSDTPQIYVKDFEEGTCLMILAFIAGSTGSVISILSRVSEYNTPQYEDKYSASFLPIFIGLFKPVIGGTFGVLVLAMLNTNWLVILEKSERTDQKWFTVVSITFVVGFSERLAKDMIGQMEDKIAINRSSVEEQVQ